MAQVFAQWFGGASYGQPYLPDDVERFDSLAAAREAFTRRAWAGDWERQRFDYVNREREEVFCPGVGHDSTMLLWMSDPSGMVDPYPDRELSFGPRGGVRLCNA